MPLVLAFLLVPLIEIALFIQVGSLIGLWATLALVLLAGVLGVWIVRREGLMAMAQMQSRMRMMRDPTEPLAHGALVLLAGALLVIPGFFSDICGLLLLVPPIRARLIASVAARVQRGPGFGPSGRPGPYDPQILDGEFTEIDPQADQLPDPRLDPSRGPPSDWTRR